MKKIRALALLSGGLDSILAAKILMEQGIEVTGLTFISYFFDSSQAEKAANDLGIPLKKVDFSKEHLEIVKSPKHGRGKAMNPCIDCHLLMLKRAKEIMEQEKFDFVATGEVLGERPLSQNRQAMATIKQESGLDGYLLRPLSAQSLEQTIPEKQGLVDRNKLLNIVGRSRKKQIALAKKWKIKNYPTPAGGCVLTDLEFGRKLKELLKIFPKAQGNDIELLKIGRHFIIGKNKIIVGRNHEENLTLEKLAQKNDILIILEEIPGPSVLARNYDQTEITENILKKAKGLLKQYSPKARNKKELEFKITEHGNN